MAKLHLIGNAHLDPVWLWRWQEGYAEVLATFRSALDRMKDFPDFTFTSAAAVYYQWVEKTDPAMFEEIRERVKEGRWSIVGGWFLQPDCNIPCGESFARHGLISQRYFREKFGVSARTGYNVDSFGHNASLPMILRQSGMDRYVFMRPSPEENGGLRDLFAWESADGSRVLAYRIPLGYNIDVHNSERIDRVHEACDRDGLPRMVFCGVGNHGGGPTVKLIKELREKALSDTDFSTVDRYFDSVAERTLPVVRDELQHHAVGCYSANSYVKQMNRKCEENLLLAEKLSVMAKELAGVPYPHKKLRKAWKNLLFNQFHDILGGCSVESAYTDASYLFGETLSITEQIIHGAMQSICGRIDTLRGRELPGYKTKDQWLIWSHEELGTPVAVFNPHPWAVQAVVKVTAVAARITDETGKDVPVQTVRGEQTNRDRRYCSAFLAELEPFGYRVYRMFCEGESAPAENPLRVGAHFLENELVRIDFDRGSGEVCGFYRKRTGEQLLPRPCEAVLVDETDCDTWAHKKAILGETVARFGAPVFTVKEAGPVRAVLNVRTVCGASELSRDYILTAGSDRLEVQTEIDFHEKHRALKFSFPLEEDEAVTASIPYGTITRRVRFQEEPFGGWLATHKLLVTTDSKYGYDTDASSVRVTVLRGAVYADHYGIRDDACRYMEQGCHRFTYGLAPRGSNADSHRLAAELTCPPRALVFSFHDGTLPERLSCFACEEEHVLVTAIKEREDGQGNLVRLLETDGRNGRVTLRLFEQTLDCELSHYSLATLDTNGERLNLIEDPVF